MDTILFTDDQTVTADRKWLQLSLNKICNKYNFRIYTVINTFTAIVDLSRFNNS